MSVATASVRSDGVVVDGRSVRPADFEGSFADRVARLALGQALPLAVERLDAFPAIEVLSWLPGFGCHIAHCRVDGREFRFVRTGKREGFFDLAGIAQFSVGGGNRHAK